MMMLANTRVGYLVITICQVVLTPLLAVLWGATAFSSPKSHLASQMGVVRSTSRLELLAVFSDKATCTPGESALRSRDGMWHSRCIR